MKYFCISVRLAVSVSLMLIISCSSLDELEENEPEAREVPVDFSFEHATWIAGVNPRQERFIKVLPTTTEEGSVHTLTAGTVTKHGRKSTEIEVTLERSLTAEECLGIYNEALRLGFFKLKEKYSEEDQRKAVEGGRGSTTTITANAATKKVIVYARRVPEIDQLIGEVQTLMR